MPYIDTHPDLNLLRHSWLTGAAFDPNELGALGIPFEDLSKIRIDDPRGMAIMRSFQRNDGNLHVFTEQVHGRPAIPDGDVGPATFALATQTVRCAMTDHPPPEGVSLAVFGEEPRDPGDNDDTTLRGALESYREWAKHVDASAARDAQEAGELPGTGAWPSCDPQNKEHHSVRVNLDTAKASSTQKNLLEEVVDFVIKAEADIGQAVRFILDGDPSEAEHDVRYEYIAGGVIGYAYFPIANTCNQVVRCRLDNSWNPSSKTAHGNLHLHEYKGHSDGLQHIAHRGASDGNWSRMNPSIITSQPGTWRGDRSFGYKKKFYGGVAITPGTDPLPPTPTPDARITSPQAIPLFLDGKPQGDYYLVPAKSLGL